MPQQGSRKGDGFTPKSFRRSAVHLFHRSAVSAPVAEAFVVFFWHSERIINKTAARATPRASKARSGRLNSRVGRKIFSVSSARPIRMPKKMASSRPFFRSFRTLQRARPRRKYSGIWAAWRSCCPSVIQAGALPSGNRRRRKLCTARVRDQVCSGVWRL